jgi:hypothetical protein
MTYLHNPDIDVACLVRIDLGFLRRDDSSAIDIVACLVTNVWQILAANPCDRASYDTHKTFNLSQGESIQSMIDFLLPDAIILKS